MILMITMGEVTGRINEVIRNVVLQIFEGATSLVNTAAVAMILIGLLLWFGARQEYWGWRLVASGIVMLIFMNIVAPMLLSFI